MTTVSFRELNALCLRYPAMFDLLSSPPGEEVEVFHVELRKMAYVKGLFQFGQLEKALKRLESLAPPTVVSSRLNLEERQAFERLREHKRLEREVRFIHRIATILGPCDQQVEILNAHAQLQKRITAQKSLRKAFKDLRLVLEDEFFKEYVKSAATLKQLLRLRDELKLAPDWINETCPKYFKMSAQYPDYARTRQLVNRLADACYRFYAACDGKVIEYLTSYPWLAYTAEGTLRKHAMEDALERKIDQFDDRIRLPDEESTAANLSGEWIPALTLTPSWLAA